jgi:hypothetical protein
VAVYLFGVVPAEERYLGSLLAGAYTTYCAQTSRWWPHWNARVWRTSGLTDVAAYERESISLIFWALLPFLSELGCYLREQPGWPHLPLPF